MHLSNLKVSIDKIIIRDINFKDGLNLVTNKQGIGRSGNSIGKSTLSRVIDYLFLGSIEAIYIDEEFKKPNEKVEALLTVSHVVATLGFTTHDKTYHEISRSLSIKKSEREFHIDGQKVDEQAYEQAIQKLCFDVTTKRPSVRALAPKFIRNDSHRMLNTTKFLDKWAAGKDYTELFLYLFGFQNTSLLTQKNDIANVVSRRARNNTVINALIKEQKPGTEIDKYTKQISDLERDFLKFEYAPEFTDPVSTLSELQQQEDVLTDKALAADRKIENINRTIELLSEKGGNYLIDELRAIYEFAGTSIDGALKSFEDVLVFHDNLVAKKKQFLSIEIPDLHKQRGEIKEKLTEIYRRKSKVFLDMRSADSIANITSKLKQLGELKVTLGKLQGVLEQQRLAASELSDAKSDMDNVLIKISEQIGIVNKFESILNTRFGEITEKIYAEKYEFSLNFNESDGTCNAEVIAGSSNPEGGKKKAEVIAFDFAYIKAVNELGINRPRFVFHDGIEDIDQNQIDDIFSIARTLPGQQIVSLLSDKLSTKMYEEYIKDSVLLLSDDDMFFKI